jgi:hypothetical protein
MTGERAHDNTSTSAEVSIPKCRHISVIWQPGRAL